MDNHGRHTSAAVGEYRTIKGRCYYYELTALKFTTAVANCKTKFDGTGRLFEPREKQISDIGKGYIRSIWLFFHFHFDEFDFENRKSNK